MKVKVIVTEQDIVNGIRHDCSSCPIALALKRVFPNSDPDVGYDSYIHRNGQSTLVLTVPPTAQDFILRFDDGEDVEPFEFEAIASGDESELI